MTRSALISLAGQPRLADGSPVTLAGKTIAARQIDYAIAAGCGHIVVLGDGARAEAVALKQMTEASGAGFQTVPDAHALLGVVGATDELLVIAPGLVIEHEPLQSGVGVHVFPAAAAVGMGFERIDADQAWAGVLVVNGGAVERLADLPRENEPAPTLLRIALQARVPTKPVSGDVLEDGSWSLLSEDDDAHVRDRTWLARHTVPAGRWAWSRKFADLVVRPWALRLMTARHAIGGFLAGLAMLLVGGIVASGRGLPIAGFVLVASGALAAAGLVRIAALRVAPFGSAQPGREALLTSFIDVALAGCIFFAIVGPWSQRFFIPAALLGALYATRPDRWPSAAALVGDRGIVAVGLAVAATFGFVAPVAMALVLAILTIAAVHSARGGLTRD